MNKNWSIGQQQARANARQSQRIQRKRDNQMGLTHTPAQSAINFSYKGVIIRKENHEYVIAKQVMISGCDTSKIDGIWNSGTALAGAIDYMLETAKAERLAEVRENHRNWTCQRCKVTCLYDKAYEEFIDTPRRHIHCKYCGFNTVLSAVNIASDEVMR